MTMRTVHTAALLACLYLCLSPAVTAEPTTYLPDGHRVYAFLERMEARSLITGAHLGTRPMTRAAAARLLADLKADAHDMPAVDREEYRCLMDEFAPGLAGEIPADDGKGSRSYLPGILGDHLYRNRRNLFSAGDGDFTLYFDPVVARTAALGNAHGDGGDDDVYIASNGLRLRGTIGDHVGFFADVRDASESGSRDYPPMTATTMPGRGFATFKGDHAEFDETHAHITYTSGPFALTWGRGGTAWGRGSSGNIGLSSWAAPADFLRLDASWWRLRFVFLAAELEQYPPVAEYYYAAPAGTVADSVTVQKRLAAHRIEIDITDRLALGLYETVIYAGRYEWSYLNPVMFLKGAEHANGDHDNAAMGMDVRWLAGHGLSLYGELFIDDISTTKLGTGWYGNKLAWQGGLFVDRPLGLDGTDARVEYTRISPWVYTHRYPVNTYTHYGDVLGHEIGPNADLVVVTVHKAFTRRLDATLAVSRSRHGENPPGVNVGGDPLDGFSSGDSTTASFLAGEVTRTTRWNVDVSYELAWECFLDIGYTWEDRDGNGISRFRAAFRLNDR